MKQRLKNQALRVVSDVNQNSNRQAGAMGAALVGFISSSLFIPWFSLVTLVTRSHTTRLIPISSH